MHVAIALGNRNLGRVWPGPGVGCVLVRNGRVTGRGWTGAEGKPHAETAAIAEAGEGARGATAYVSLEPCAHHGRTPPCSRALIAAGVARVVTPISDPDQRVSGRGHRELEQAGVSVSTGVLQREARAAHAGYLSRVERARPSLTLKLATSLDGRLATATGESRWITGSAARRHVHMERLRHDAVLVGRGTIAADDPDLTVRIRGLRGNEPAKIFFDSALRTHVSSRLGQAARTSRVFAVHTSEAKALAVANWQGAGARTIEVDRTASGLADAKCAMAALASLGLTRILCEGGGRLAASLLDAKLVDRMLLFSAGLHIGKEGKPSFGDIGPEALSMAPRWRLESSRSVGGDTMSIWVSETAFDA